jgi:hypothetical protein
MKFLVFIEEITSRAFLNADACKRRTINKSDIARAITRSDQFDFLIDIVPREDPNASSHNTNSHSNSNAGPSNPVNAPAHGNMGPNGSVSHTSVGHANGLQQGIMAGHAGPSTSSSTNGGGQVKVPNGTPGAQKRKNTSDHMVRPCWFVVLSIDLAFLVIFFVTTKARFIPIDILVRLACSSSY